MSDQLWARSGVVGRYLKAGVVTRHLKGPTDATPIREPRQSDGPVLEGLPATVAYEEAAEHYDGGCRRDVTALLAKADAMHDELLASRAFYRNSSEARSKRIERLEWMLDELITSSTAGFATTDGWARDWDHDEVIDYLGCRFELAHR